MANRPYVDVTTWIQQIWDAINEIRAEIDRLHADEDGLYARVDNLEEAIGKGLYDEYRDGPANREVIIRGDNKPCCEE